MTAEQREILDDVTRYLIAHHPLTPSMATRIHEVSGLDMSLSDTSHCLKLFGDAIARTGFFDEKSVELKGTIEDVVPPRLLEGPKFEDGLTMAAKRLHRTAQAMSGKLLEGFVDTVEQKERARLLGEIAGHIAVLDARGVDCQMELKDGALYVQAGGASWSLRREELTASQLRATVAGLNLLWPL